MIHSNRTHNRLLENTNVVSGQGNLQSMLKQVLEKTREFGIETHHLSINFKSAYESVDRMALYKGLLEFRIPTHLIKLIQESLSKVECKV